MDILLSAAIISLLSSVFMFRVSEARKIAEDGHMKTEAHEISNAIALYRSDHQGRAPLSTSGTTGVLYAENNSSSEYVPTMQILVDEGYLAEIPTSPDGDSYYYGVSENYEEAIFSANLNNPSSGDSTNSCNFELTYDIPQSAYIECEGSYFYTPPATCSMQQQYAQNGMISMIMVCTNDPGYWICPASIPVPAEVPLCDGSSDLDYCECI